MSDWKDVQYKDGKLRTHTSGGGGSSHNYSTDEQVIGTWIDGKPLYEKTISDTLPEVTVNGTFASKNIDISALNPSAIVDIKIIAYFNGQWYSLQYLNNSGYQAKGFVDLNDTAHIQLVSNATAFSEANCYITIQYTKTTD